MARTIAKVLTTRRKQDLTVKFGSQEEQEKQLALSLWEPPVADARAIVSNEDGKFDLESPQGVSIDKVDPQDRS